MQKRKDMEKYLTIFEEAPDGIFIINTRGNFLLVNNQFCEALGYGREELLQSSIQKTCLECELDLIKERNIKLGKQQKVLVERTIKRKDKSLFYARIHYKIIAEDRILGILHEMKVQDQLLQQIAVNNEERFKQITEHIRDVFFLVDLASANFLYISQAYERIWEQPIAKLLEDPTSWIDSIHPEDKARIKLLYQKQLKTGYLDERYRIVLKDGSIRWIHARTFPIYNTNNQLYRSAGVAEDITEHMQIIKERADFSERLKMGFNDLVVALSAALEQRDSYTSGHQNKVAHISKAIAQELNLPLNQVQCIELSAHLHDIGKIGIPIEILTKSNKLTKIEFDMIKTHCEIGYNILKKINFPYPIAEIIRQHHERLDGSGYPRGLKGDQIKVEAKIIAVADTIDAMSSHRPYRPSLGLKVALNTIQNNSGILFDPHVVNAAIKVMKNEKGLYLS